MGAGSIATSRQRLKCPFWRRHAIDSTHSCQTRKIRIGLIRNATLILELSGRRILVDPMLDDMGARPAIDNTPNPARNPTVPLPFPAEQVVAGLDAVLVSHRHRDHLDERGIEL